jgi:hypothetical protein
MALFAAFFLVSTVLRAKLGAGASFTMWPLWVVGPIIAAIQRKPNVEELAVVASAEGLSLGGKLVPRAKLKSAVSRTEEDRTFVHLRTTSPFGTSVDVEVHGDDEADHLCRALGLDAASTTAEFSLFRSKTSFGPLAATLMAFGAAFGFVVAIVGHSRMAMIAMPFALLAAFVISMPLLALARTVKLRVGADGILVREGLGRRVFYPHDAITEVRAEGPHVVLERAHGGPLTYSARGQQRRKEKLVEEQGREAESVVWRIEKAREACRALAGATPALGSAALVLERGERTIQEWLDELRRVGEGANVTFRNALLTRSQLVDIVESTTLAAKVRLAAAIALRSKLSDDEKPRLRVAAERCVLPDLRERMVRVIDAPSDEDVAAPLEEADAAAEVSASPGRSRM